jgi:NAD(P)H-nitrite reductase large subunit
MAHDDCGCGCGGHGDDTAHPHEPRQWEAIDDEEIICHCSKISKKTLVDAIRNGAYTIPLLKILTGIGRTKSCPNNHECVHDAMELVQVYGTTTLSDALISLDEE